VVWIAIGVSVAMRLLYLLQIRHNPYFDFPVLDEGYHDQWARELASGELTKQIPFFRAPLYPFFLSVFYRLPGPTHFALIRGVQLMMGAVTPALVWAITRRLMPGRPRAATIAAFIVGLDGILYHFEAELLLESVLAPMTALLVLLMLRAVDTGTPRRWFAAGLVLGAFAITRPNVLLAAPLLFVLALGWHAARFSLRRWGSALALTLGTCLFVLPVSFLNWSVGGDRVLVASQGGLNFYFGNNGHSNGWAPGAPGIRKGWWEMVADSKHVAEQAEGRTLRPSEVSGYWYGRGLAWWRDHPGDALTLTAKKTVFLLSGLELPSNRDTGLFLREFAPPFLPCLYLFHIVIPLALVGAFGSWRRGGVGARAVILYTLIYMAGIVMFFINDRYRVPLRPLFEIFAVTGGYMIYDDLRARSWRGAWPAAVAVVLGVALNVNPWVSENRRSLWQFYDSAASVYADKGQFDEAIDFEKKWIALGDPPRLPALRYLGEIYLRAGRASQAIEALESAHTVAPGDVATLQLLMKAYMTTGQLDAADRMFAETEAAGFDSAQVLLGHAIILESLARPASTVEAMYRRVVEKEPRFAQGWDQLAAFEARAGHLEQAVQMWQTALQIAPDSPGVSENLERAKHELAAKSAGSSAPAP
jgi:hypothetical protein